jgi:hypothetical protein
VFAVDVDSNWSMPLAHIDGKVLLEVDVVDDVCEQ